MVTMNKKVKEEYKKTNRAKEMNKLLMRIILEGIITIGIAIYFIVQYCLNKEISNLALSIVFFIFGLIFLIGQWRVREKEYLNFAKSAKKK